MISLYIECMSHEILSECFNSLFTARHCFSMVEYLSSRGCNFFLKYAPGWVWLFDEYWLSTAPGPTPQSKESVWTILKGLLKSTLERYTSESSVHEMSSHTLGSK